MIGILINAEERTIKQVEVFDYQHKLQLLGCNLLEHYPYDLNGNDIWTDEEANLKDKNFFFTINDYVVSGNALILGYDDEGNSTDIDDLTVEELTPMVTFHGEKYIDHSKLNFRIETVH